MDTIKLIIPKELIKSEHQHPETYGECHFKKGRMFIRMMPGIIIP